MCGRVFHSMAYKCKGKSASYFVRFVTSVGRLGYARILLFVSIRGNGFAVVQLFRPKFSGLFENVTSYPTALVEQLSRSYLGNGFVHLEQTEEVSVLPTGFIKNRIIFIPNNGLTSYASNELNSYQHD